MADHFKRDIFFFFNFYINGRIRPDQKYKNIAINRDGTMINVKTGRMLKVSLDKDEYLISNLCSNGKDKHFKIRRLVLKHLSKIQIISHK